MSAFLQIANLATRQQHVLPRRQAEHHLDEGFLSSYFGHHPGATAADEALFVSPTVVMDHFIRSRLLVNGNGDGSGGFVQLLRGVAAALERHAAAAGALRAAAKAMFVVLSMSPLRDCAGYTPRAAASSSSSSSSSAAEQQRLRVQHAVLNSALPWERLRPLLREIEQAIGGNGAAPSSTAGLFALAPGGLELLCACADGAPHETNFSSATAATTATAGSTTFLGDVPLAPNARREHDFFTAEVCGWAATSPSSLSAPRRRSGESASSAVHAEDGDCDLGGGWSAAPPDWAQNAVSPAPVGARAERASALRRAQEREEQEELVFQAQQQQRRREEEESLLRTAARRTDFLRWEVPARLGGGNASWTAIWHAMHRACIGHGDTLGIVGPTGGDVASFVRIATRVTVWPPALSFAPALLARFCACGTLVLRIRQLIQLATESSARQPKPDQSTNNDDDINNNNRPPSRFFLGRIGAAIFSAVQRFVRDFEADVGSLAEKLVSAGSGGGDAVPPRGDMTARKVTHRMILERAALLQRDYCPRVFLVAELLHVATTTSAAAGRDGDDDDDDDDGDRRHWSAAAALSRLGSGAQMLNSLYRWLAANEVGAAPSAPSLDGADDEPLLLRSTTMSAADRRVAQLHAVVRELFLEGLHQFHAMLFAWVQRGILEDPFGEFFLQQRQQQQASVAALRAGAAVPDFFAGVDTALVRDAGLAQQLLLAERRTGCVGVLWERVDEIDAMWPSAETLIWSTAPPDPAAVLAMWRDFVVELLPHSVTLLSSMPATAAAQQQKSDLEEPQHAGGAVESVRHEQQRSARFVDSAATSTITVSAARAAISDGARAASAAAATHAQIWDGYMAEAKRDAARALIAEHEQRMAASERRAERAVWRRRRIGLAQQRRAALQQENDSIVATLQEFVQSGRPLIVIPMAQPVAVSHDIDRNAVITPPAPPQEQSHEHHHNCHDGDDDAVLVEVQGGGALDDATDDAASTVTDTTTTTTTTTATLTAAGAAAAAPLSVPKWKQPKHVVARIGEAAENGAEPSRHGEAEEVPDFTWDPLHDAIGSNPEFETPEQITERTLLLAQKLLPSSVAAAADDNWFLPHDSNQEQQQQQPNDQQQEERRRRRQRHAGEVHQWAQDCMALSVPRERKRRIAADDDGDDADDDAIVPVAQLCDRYRSVFAPLCRRLIQRALRVALADPCGSLRSVTDALVAACMLQDPRAAVGLQDQLLRCIAPSLFDPAASGDAVGNSSSSSSSPLARLRSCGAVWSRFWHDELAGEHARFLRLSLLNTVPVGGSSVSGLVLLQHIRFAAETALSASALGAESSSNTASDATASIYRHFLDALLPAHCVERHGRILCSLLTWTLVDKMCVALWRSSASRRQGGNAGTAPAALWGFVIAARGVLTALRQHTWHAVCSAAVQFRCALDAQLARSDGAAEDDGASAAALLGFGSFSASYERLLVQASDACWLGHNHVDVRKTLSVLMRLVEQVYNMTVVAQSQQAVQQQQQGLLSQVTEQFVTSARALQAQILAASTPTGVATSDAHSTAAAYAVAAAIGAALPRQVRA